jgi:hypothetical protein
MVIRDIGHIRDSRAIRVIVAMRIGASRHYSFHTNKNVHRDKVITAAKFYTHKSAAAFTAPLCSY